MLAAGLEQGGGLWNRWNVKSPSIGDRESYEDLRDAMQAQTYWVRFFIRPCCLRPSEDTARALVERLKGEIDDRAV